MAEDKIEIDLAFGGKAVGRVEDGKIVWSESEMRDLQKDQSQNQELHGSVDWRHNLKRSTSSHRVHVASLPLVIYNDLKRRGILDDPKAFSRWLNDPDNSVFRTGGGRVALK